MNQLKCEMCGSTDLVKQDGMFVCQVCGTKYSVEEAKKMMNVGEESVGVGSVKADTSEELANLYQIARRAKDDDNSENAAKYYDMILVKDPTSWEASFYLVYFQAMQCKIAGIRAAAVSVGNCVQSVLKLIKNNVTSEEKQVEAVKEIAMRCTLIANMLFNGAMNHYNGIDYNIKNNYTQEMLNNCAASREIFYICGDTIELLFGNYENLHPVAVAMWKQAIDMHNNLMKWFSDKEGNKNRILQYVAKIQKYDRTYQPPEINMKSDACYVATCVYGSYDCPQVWTLRRYRDNVLGVTRRGRAFIRCYYAVSPTLVKWFGSTSWFKKLWRGKLDKMVQTLQGQGVEDTPYKDIDWRKNARLSPKRK